MRFRGVRGRGRDGGVGGGGVGFFLSGEER